MENSQAGRSIWKSYASALAVCLVAFMGLVASVPVLASLVVKRFSENYAWQARQALDAGNASEATIIAETRAAEEHYDFLARRLLAKARLADNKSAEAVDIMLKSLDSARSIRGRDVYSVGFDLANDYQLLSEALAQQGRTDFAGEMARAAADAQRMTLGEPGDSHTSQTTYASANVNLQANEAEFRQGMDLTAFQLSSGVSGTSSGTLLFSRNSRAAGALPLDQSSKFLRAQIRGGKAMGFGGMLILSINNVELVRIYADNVEARWLSVPLPMVASPTTMPLTAQFVNDGFDPITKADRNVELMQLEVLHASPRDAFL